MLDKLNQYKELIAIIVFFLSGFFWLQSEFPNKDDLKSELGAIRCQLDQYMKLTQLQILNQDQEKQLGALKAQLASSGFDGSEPLSMSPAMKIEFDQLKQDYASTRAQLKQTTIEMTRIRDELQRGVCGKLAS